LRPAALLALLTLAPGCLSDGNEPGAARALDYLEATDDELGADVVFALQIYAALTGEPRAADIARARRARLAPADMARYGAFLDLDAPVLPAASLAGVAPPADAPDPEADLGDDRVATCPEGALSCDVSAQCEDFARLDSWGYVLTHQALWLLVGSWSGCALPVDVEAHRRALASRLAAEARFDPVAGDLFFERLTMLGHLGFADEIAPEWIEELLSSQRPEGCFPVDEATVCHPHPTALALWTLALVQ